jgi:DNA modification methylase
MIEYQVESIPTTDLFANIAVGLLERNQARKESIDDRVAKCADIVYASNEQFVIWCHRNEEALKLTKLIDGAVDVAGSDSIEHKEQSVNDFLDNKIRVLISKPRILGAGMNFQNCHNTCFVGLSDSWEQYYQAIRRFYRFGQTHEVNVHVISAESEGAVVANIKRKEIQNDIMGAEMVNHISKSMKNEIFGASAEKDEYMRQVHTDDSFTLHNADCIDLAREIESDSVDFSIYSPPFESLFSYSNSDRDMGNNKSSDDFKIHYQYLIDEMYRIMKPGRLVAVHCMNLTTSKVNDGYIGIRDFRGDIIRAHQKAGFIYHSEVCIWKDPVVAMQRTKALGLLHKTIKKDSTMSRQGLADYLVIFRKHGVNPDAVSHTADEFPVEKWQRYASPVWFDIDQSRTLNFREAREDDDVKHICPLQLDVIERAIDLWTANNDLVFSPFTGVGSEGYCAVKMGRRFIGSELKKSYYEMAIKNLNQIKKQTQDLFAA